MSPLDGIAVLSVAWALGLITWGVSWYYPKFGTRPLVYTGGLIILLVVVTQRIYHPIPVPASEHVTVAKAANRIAAEVVRRRTKELAEFEDQSERDEREDKVPPQVTVDSPISRQDWPLILNAAALDAAVDLSLQQQGPIWPVFLAWAAFLYVWWLAIITFDLTFVWHLYIRWSGAQKLVIQRLDQAGRLSTKGRGDVPPRPIRRKAESADSDTGPT